MAKKGQPDDLGHLLAAGVAILAGTAMKSATDRMFREHTERNRRNTEQNREERMRAHRRQTEERVELLETAKARQRAMRKALDAVRQAGAQYDQLYRGELARLGEGPHWIRGAFHDIAFADRCEIDPAQIDLSRTGGRAGTRRTFADRTTTSGFTIFEAQDVSNCGGVSTISFGGHSHWFRFHKDPLLGSILSIGPRDAELSDGDYRHFADLAFAAMRVEDAPLREASTIAIHPSGRLSDYDAVIPEPPKSTRILAIESTRLKGQE